MVSLQAQVGEDGLTLEGLLTCGGEEERVVERLTLRAAVADLPDRERQVVALRYGRGMTQTAAARVLGVSQVQVSRLERRALERLRREWNKKPPRPPESRRAGRFGDIDDSLPLAEGRLREAAKGRECKVQERGGLTPPPP